MGRNVAYGMSCGAATALSSSYPAAGIEVSNITATDARALDVPTVCKLSWLHGELDTLAASAATITWFVAADSGGDIPITDAVTETILVGQTTATDGGIATVLDTVWVTIDTASSAGSLYVFAKTDTGTINLLPRLFWER